MLWNVWKLIPSGSTIDERERVRSLAQRFGQHAGQEIVVLEKSQESEIGRQAEHQKQLPARAGDATRSIQMAAT